MRGWEMGVGRMVTWAEGAARAKDGRSKCAEGSRKGEQLTVFKCRCREDSGMGGTSWKVPKAKLEVCRQGCIESRASLKLWDQGSIMITSA